GHRVTEAKDGNTAIQQVFKGHFDLLFLDFKMPGMNGIEVLKKIKDINPQISVVMMTAYGTIETAVDAMKLGAVDYIPKPIDLDELIVLVDRIAERRTLIRENEILRKKLWKKEISTGQIIYKDPGMEEIVNMAGRVASSRTTVLILGESGTGKELFARLVHATSPRAGKPMIVVNCGAIPETLLESELFGHEKGAFTGAVKDKPGRFELAHGGTIFLDEIGDTSLALQAKLLRVLQEKEYERVGGIQTRKSDVRVIAATNKELRKEIEKGNFREDLYYRLCVVPITLPPLRERREDIPLLVEAFIEKFNARGQRLSEISTRAMATLMAYDWPGNVRELENAIEHAYVTSNTGRVERQFLPASLQRTLIQGPLATAMSPLKDQQILQALEAHRWRKNDAARDLGMSRTTLWRKLKQLGLE
ncbi:MAG: sigma-54-dependent Fis family transcriptional regulator, partial [Desulfuromonadales bacterium]|nr:sigma-54-dependent Fis family transcriptional regulator [Desulfuromonadales bacterium]